MRVAVLGSGSGGNSLIIESGGRPLMIDAGFSCRQIEQRLAGLDQEASGIEALLLTHEHSDHCRGVEVLQRRHEIPVYATTGTFDGLKWSDRAVDPDLRTIRSGEPFLVPGFRVEAFQIPHDARQPVGYVVEDEAGCRLGLAADLGSRTQLAWGRLKDLDCLVIETNHDLTMLRAGPYPWHLKQRVASRHGHLSNHDAAAGLEDLVSDRLRSVVLYHLSATNNLPALAAQEVGEKLAAVGSGAEIVVTRQDQATPWVEITAGRPAAPGGVAATGRRQVGWEPEPRQLDLW